MKLLKKERYESNTYYYRRCLTSLKKEGEIWIASTELELLIRYINSTPNDLKLKIYYCNNFIYTRIHVIESFKPEPIQQDINFSFTNH